MPTKSLLDKARESARCARERAHKRWMWGGQMQQQEEEDMYGGNMKPMKMTPQLKKQVQDAIKRAKQAEKSARSVQEKRKRLDDEQEGGYKNSVPEEKVQKRKLLLQRNLPAGGILPSDKTIKASMRTYKVEVDGAPLGEKRYFRGLPGAAARKVVSILAKKEGKGASVTGSHNNVHIKLIETTKGVHKSDKHRAKGDPLQPYTLEYYGWREALEEEKDTGRQDPKGNPIIARYKYIAIPKRSAPDFKGALALHKEASARTKANRALMNSIEARRGQSIPKVTPVRSIIKESHKK